MIDSISNSKNRSYSEKLASFIKNIKFADIPEKDVQKAKHCLLDWLGAVFAAYENPLSTQYINNEFVEKGENLIIGTDKKVNLLGAIFAHGALGHIAEVDDGHRKSILHPGAVAIPVVISLALKNNISGKKMIESIIAGYEVVIRVGECLGEEHYSIWHTTATAGTFGAAASASKMLDLDTEEIVYALGHAGTQAAGLWQFLNDGCASAKPLHPAKASLNGLISAILAKKGIKGARNILEGEKGFCKATSTNYDLNKLDRKLGKTYKIATSNFKGYPTCGHTHSAIDATKKIMQENDFTVDEIDNIKIDAYQKTIDVAGNPSPQDLESAKFSLYFCIGALLTKGEINFKNLYKEDLQNKQINEIMKKIKLNFDPELNKKFPKSRPCRVSIKLKNGKQMIVENYYRFGDPEKPMTRGDVIKKFNQLSLNILNEDKRNKIIKNIFNLDSIENFNELNEILSIKGRTI